jgi:pimeloyl-ACP methyl ester carboxylesterase
MISDLRRDHRVIAPDLRGMGRNAFGHEMTATAWTDDLGTLLDHLEIRRAHLAGTSLGARVATRFALADPGRAQSLIVDAIILGDSPAGTAALTSRFGHARSSEMAANLERWNGPAWREVADAYLETRAMSGLQEHLSFSASELARIECPALVCRGDRDDAIHPIAHSVTAHACFPDSWLWIAPETGFSVFRFRPAEAAELVRARVRPSASLRMTH